MTVITRPIATDQIQEKIPLLRMQVLNRQYDPSFVRTINTLETNYGVQVTSEFNNSVLLLENMTEQVQQVLIEEGWGVKRTFKGEELWTTNGNYLDQVCKQVIAQIDEAFGEFLPGTDAIASAIKRCSKIILSDHNIELCLFKICKKIGNPINLVTPEQTIIFNTTINDYVNKLVTEFFNLVDNVVFTFGEYKQYNSKEIVSDKFVVNLLRSGVSRNEYDNEYYAPSYVDLRSIKDKHTWTTIKNYGQDVADKPDFMLVNYTGKLLNVASSVKITDSNIEQMRKAYTFLYSILELIQHPKLAEFQKVVNNLSFAALETHAISKACREVTNLAYSRDKHATDYARAQENLFIAERYKEELPNRIKKILAGINQAAMSTDYVIKDVINWSNEAIVLQIQTAPSVCRDMTSHRQSDVVFIPSYDVYIPIWLNPLKNAVRIAEFQFGLQLSEPYTKFKTRRGVFCDYLFMHPHANGIKQPGNELIKYLYRYKQLSNKFPNTCLGSANENDFHRFQREANVAGLINTVINFLRTSKVNGDAWGQRFHSLPKLEDVEIVSGETVVALKSISTADITKSTQLLKQAFAKGIVKVEQTYDRDSDINKIKLFL